MMKRLILLCDYGLDDAIATVFLLNNADRFNGIDIVPIGGNVPQSTAFENGMVLLANYDGELNGVRLINTEKIKQPEEELYDIHGKDGMGGVLERKYVDNVEKVDFFDWLLQIEDLDCVILSLGPCTITEHVLDKKPDCDLVMMGGCINEAPNYNGYEFNHGMDIRAFEKCIKHKHRIATLDSCSAEKLDFMNKKEFNDTLIDKLIRSDIETTKSRGEQHCYIYDYIAAISLVHSELFTVQKAEDKDGNLLNNLIYIGDDIYPIKK